MDNNHPTTIDKNINFDAEFYLNLGTSKFL